MSPNDTIKSPADIRLWAFYRDSSEHHRGKEKFALIHLLWLEAASRVGGPSTFKVAVVLGQVYSHVKKPETYDPAPPVRASLRDLCFYGLKPAAVRQGLSALERAGLIRREPEQGGPGLIYVLCDRESTEPFRAKFVQELSKKNSSVRKEDHPTKQLVFASAINFVEKAVQALGFKRCNEGEKVVWKQDDYRLVASDRDDSLRVSVGDRDVDRHQATARNLAGLRITPRQVNQSEITSGARIECPLTQSGVHQLCRFLRRTYKRSTSASTPATREA